jgi:Icc-related predicted phosphoesterase
MKLLAFVDVHANTLALRELGKKARDADLLVCAGDISVFGQGLVETMKTMDSWNKPCLVIHGNHDDEDETRELCEQSKNLIFLHGSEQKIGALTFTGWGGGGFSRKDREFESWAKTLKPITGRVLVTHAPPYGTAIDFQPHFGEHVGCQSYTDAIDKLQPSLALAGHIHECFGEHEQRGKTIILNPGPLGVVIELEAKNTNKETPTKPKPAKKKGAK